MTQRRTSDRPLDAYFDALTSTQRLTAQDEIDLARALRAAKHDTWRHLLGAPAHAVRTEVREVLGERAPPMDRSGGAWAPTLCESLALVDRDGRAARRLTAWVRAHPGCGVDSMRVQAAINQTRAVRNRFVEANLGLVVSVARRYERRLFSLSDLIQEGNAGLLKAVDRFDPELGNRFSTYAVWWIRHAIGRALSDRGREIRLPVHVAERQQTLLRARNEFEGRHGRSGTARELAEATGFTVERVKALLAVDFRRATGHDPNTKTSQPLLVDELPADPPAYDDALDAELYQDGLHAAIETLPTMMQAIIRQRFGLDGAPPMTLREVGRLHDLSRERIRQIQMSALARMRETFDGRGLVA